MSYLNAAYRKASYGFTQLIKISFTYVHSMFIMKCAVIRFYFHKVESILRLCRVCGISD